MDVGAKLKGAQEGAMGPVDAGHLKFPDLVKVQIQGKGSRDETSC
jgi:hypothetical protein